MKTIRFKKAPGAFEDVNGVLVSPNEGSEIPVSDDTAKTMIDDGFAEEVKEKRGKKAETGPEETR